jgi:hypothetical protein
VLYARRQLVRLTRIVGHANPGEVQHQVVVPCQVNEASEPLGGASGRRAGRRGQPTNHPFYQELGSAAAGHATLVLRSLAQLGWCIEICRSVQVGLQTWKVWICSSTMAGSAGPWSRTTK